MFFEVKKLLFNKYIYFIIRQVRWKLNHIKRPADCPLPYNWGFQAVRKTLLPR